MSISLCASPSPMSRSAWPWNYIERGARTNEKVPRTGCRAWKGSPFREERPRTGQGSRWVFAGLPEAAASGNLWRFASQNCGWWVDSTAALGLTHGISEDQARQQWEELPMELTGSLPLGRPTEAQVHFRGNRYQGPCPWGPLGTRGACRSHLIKDFRFL